MNGQIRKPLIFVGRSRKDLIELPVSVKQEIGFNLDQVQCGETPDNAKKFKGLSGVMELVEDYNTDTYRAVYIANINNKVYVLHCFKKKSKSGIATPPKDINLIKQRFKEALEISKGG